MSLPQDSPLTIGLKFENDLGKFEVDQIKDLKSKINLGKLEFGHILDLEFTITCPISKVKVICEQETNTQEKEVETIPLGITCIEKDMLRIIKDPKKAIDYFERAANLDYEKALYQLSEMYLYGESGVKKDEEKAFQYLEKAAKMPKKHCDNENLWL
ncbi:hypothetical protein QTN25_002101 [Entamoeba marina]